MQFSANSLYLRIVLIRKSSSRCLKCSQHAYASFSEERLSEGQKYDALKKCLNFILELRTDLP